ncbi:MAG TPA: CBS domain-containing protein [Planctomycetota bacterium]
MVALKEVMSRHFESVHPDAPARDAFRLMSSLNLSMLPVREDRRLVGMLSDVPASGEESALRVRDVMSPDVLTGLEDQDVRELIVVMRRRDIRTLPVLDANQELVGVFTLGGPWKRSGGGPRRPASEGRVPP